MGWFSSSDDKAKRAEQEAADQALGRAKRYRNDAHRAACKATGTKQQSSKDAEFSRADDVYRRAVRRQQRANGW